MKLTREFEHNGAKVTVFRRTVRSKLHSDLLYNSLGLTTDTSPGRYMEMFHFIRLLTQTTIEGDIGFAIPDVAAPPEELQAGLEAFMSADEALFMQLQKAFTEVNAAVNNDALLPPDKVSKKKETITEDPETTS